MANLARRRIVGVKTWNRIAAIMAIIVGFLLVIAWWLVGRPDTAPAPVSTTNKSELSASTPMASKPAAEPRAVFYANGITVLGVVPTGWQDKSCDASALFLAPPTKPTVACQSDDQGFISMMFQSGEAVQGPYDCDGEATTRERYQQDEWFVSYDCDNTSIGGQQGVKETSRHNDKIPLGDTAGGVVTYSISVSEDRRLVTSYAYSDDTGHPEYIEAFENFARSLKFEYDTP